MYLNAKSFYSLIWDSVAKLEKLAKELEEEAFYSLIWDFNVFIRDNRYIRIYFLSIPLYGIETVREIIDKLGETISLSIPLYGICRC